MSALLIPVLYHAGIGTLYSLSGSRTYKFEPEDACETLEEIYKLAPSSKNPPPDNMPKWNLTEADKILNRVMPHADISRACTVLDEATGRARFLGPSNSSHMPTSTVYMLIFRKHFLGNYIDPKPSYTTSVIDEDWVFV
jgi:hypothetical protein